MGRYICTHMHLHSCFEVTASMESQCSQAKQVGAEALFLSDHDTYLGARVPHNGCNFEQGLSYRCERHSNGEASLEDWYAYCQARGMGKRVEAWRAESLALKEKRSKGGWKIESTSERCTALSTSELPFIGNKCMRLSVVGSNGACGTIKATYMGSHKGYNRSLLAGVHVGLALRCDRGFIQKTRFSLGFTLSGHPGTQAISELRYTSGCGPQTKPDGTAWVDFQLIADNAWHYYIFNLSNDASRSALGGEDNALNALYCCVETNDTQDQVIWVDHLTIWDDLQMDALHQKQSNALKEIGEKYCIAAYAAVEISESGHHMTSFSEQVPVIDYPAQGYTSDEKTAVNHIRRYHGVYSYNHPFSRFRYLTMSDAERALAKEYEIGLLLKSRANGADFLEVGFPEGRYGFELSDYLELWDTLSMAGLCITGYGDSDSHWVDRRWIDGNNMAAVIWSESLAREDLLQGLRTGNVYSVDPVQFKAGLQLSVDEVGAEMGSVIICEQERVFFVKLRLQNAESGWQIRWIDDGAETELTRITDANSCIMHIHSHHTSQGFCRAEIYQGVRCIAFTNPLYFSCDKDKRPDCRAVFPI